MQAEHLGVSLGLRALLKKQVDLYAITVDRRWCGLRATPAQHQLAKAAALQFLKQRNYCRPPRLPQSGTVNYNDQQIPLAAELDDFKASVQFDAAANKYLGSLVIAKAAGNGRQNPEDTPLMSSFIANRDGVVLDPIVLSAGGRASPHVSKNARTSPIR